MESYNSSDNSERQMTSKLGNGTKGATKSLRCENTQRRVSSRKVSAVIPCLNEEETLGICVEKAFRCFHEIGVDGEVVVADNGSTDRSLEIARKLGARLIHQKVKLILDSCQKIVL